MGIRLHNSSWHRPLRTLDSWLPVSDASTSRWDHRLRQCGRWLHLLRQSWSSCHPQHTTHASPTSTRDGSGAGPGVARPKSVGIKVRVTQHDDQPGRAAGHIRLVISGRMADVCAELDRLAALEDRHLPQGS